LLSRITRARAGSVATLGALALAAALVDLGAIHRHETGDSIVPVLVSLQRWTFFYWDQERYGMLVPLLAVPVRDPLANLLLQRGLLVLAGLAALPLLARHALAGRDWRLAGALAAALLLLAAPARWQFEYLGNQPYGVSLALALAGLALAAPGGTAHPGRGVLGRRPGRLAAGLALVLLAHWVNAAAGLLLLPLAVARAAVDRLEGEAAPGVRDRLIVDCGLLVAGVLAGQAAIRLWPIVTGATLRLATGFLPAREWPGAWASFLGTAWSASGAWPAALGAAATAGVGAMLAVPALRPLLRGALLRAAALCAAGLAYALLTGALEWVRDNHFHWRYLAPAAILVHLAAASLLAEPLSRLARVARPALVLALVLVPVAALDAWGRPSLAGVRADLDGVAGRWTEDVLGARCALVAGEYWSVWPAVWHAAWAARERGLPAEIHGIAHRATPTAIFWKDGRGPLRICRVRGDEAQAEKWLGLFHLWPARLVERRTTVDVLETTPGGR
jgi:hypothetical protein